MSLAYVIGVKEKDHRWLFDWVNTCKDNNFTMRKAGNSYKFNWQNNVPLNESQDHIRVNCLECIETNAKGKRQCFTWITDFTITEEDIYIIMRIGRSRWKGENEAFNTLKNQGYHFEHNCGHGYKH